MSRAGSSRWSPTPEQLMILEELYRSGTRTPTASQIQQITTHLCFYGRIEGKNVFYWFQNHKARDRQKLRRKLNRQLQLQQQQQQQQQQMQVHHYQLNIQDKSHHCFFCGFNSSCGYSSTQQISFYDPAISLSRGEAADTSEKTETSFCDYGWTTRPLKTLDLFPTTATKLEEDCTTSSNIH